jgi:hypothetical protein
LIDPASRTTSWPADRRGAVTPVSWPETTNRTTTNAIDPPMPSAPQVDKDGWRPSNR